MRVDKIIYFSLVINALSCKAIQNHDSSQVLDLTDDSGQAQDFAQFDRSVQLASLDSIDRLLVAGAKESQSSFGQIILIKSSNVDSSNQHQSFQINVPYNLTLAEKVELNLRLKCPEGAHCEAWDRLGSIMVEPQFTNGKKVSIEILRFMTPYGEGANWVADVTDYAAILSGQYTLKTYIESWSSLAGKTPAGWTMILELKVTGKNSSRLRPAGVWPVINYSQVPYGDPATPAIRKGSVPGLNNKYKKAVLKTIITGHGQANTENCAEFCQKKHTVKIGAQSYFPAVWRGDCSTSVSPTQKGSYQHSRAGWCPGDYVRSQAFDVTSAMTANTNQTAYFPSPYVNSCRPGQNPCNGCDQGVQCAYDGNEHTPPYWLVTAHVVFFR